MNQISTRGVVDAMETPVVGSGNRRHRYEQGRSAKVKLSSLGNHADGMGNRPALYSYAGPTKALALVSPSALLRHLTSVLPLTVLQVSTLFFAVRQRIRAMVMAIAKCSTSVEDRLDRLICLLFIWS